MTADGYYVEPPRCVEHAVAYEWRDGTLLPAYDPDFRPLGWVCPCDPGHPDPHHDHVLREWQDRHADLAATLRSILAMCGAAEAFASCVGMTDATLSTEHIRDAIERTAMPQEATQERRTQPPTPSPSPENAPLIGVESDEAERGSHPDPASRPITRVNEKRG